MRYKRIVRTAGIWGIAAIVFFGNLSGTMQTVHGEEYEYDALNRVIKVIYEEGSYVEYSYDSNGNIVKITVHTDQSEEPDQPGEPDKPGEPDQPGEPDKPGEPDAPEEPDKPTEPDSTEIPVKPWRPIRDDRADEADESQEQTDTSDIPFDFSNPFEAGNVGATVKAVTGKAAAEFRTDTKGEKSAEETVEDDIIAPLESEESTQREINQEDTETAPSNDSEAGTIGIFQVLVIVFQVFFIRILQWLAQTV